MDNSKETPSIRGRLKLDGYSEYVSRYEGWGQVRTRAGKSGRAFFDARQMPDSTLILGCFLDEIPFDDDGIFDAHEIVSGDFLTAEGFKINTAGTIISIFSGLEVHHFSVERLCVQLVEEPSVADVRFPISNFLPMVESISEPPPERGIRLFQWPISVSVRGLDIEISRTVDENWLIRQRYMPDNRHPTAECSIRSSDQRPVDFDSMSELAIELLKPLSLATGTRVSTSTITGVNKRREAQIILYNNYPPHPFASIITSSIWHPNIPTIIGAWLDEAADRPISANVLASAIDIFVDSCSPYITLEARCLIACCLLDALANRLSQVRGNTTIIPDEVFSNKLHPRLCATIETIAAEENTISQADKDQLIAAVQGSNRVSFRRRLKAMLDDLDIAIVEGRLGNDIVHEITRTRNSLVHEGEFLSRRLHPAVHFFENVGATRAMGFHDYINVLWACYCVLLRLVGYSGNLPDVRTPPWYSGASAQI